MTGPVNARALAHGTLDELVGRAGWNAPELAQAFWPAPIAENFRPDDAVLRFAGALARHPDGRAFLDWLLDLTCRAPYPRAADGTDALAVAAAKHMARAAVGEAIVAAVADGQRLLDRRS